MFVWAEDVTTLKSSDRSPIGQASAHIAWGPPLAVVVVLVIFSRARPPVTSSFSFAGSGGRGVCVAMGSHLTPPISLWSPILDGDKATGIYLIKALTRFNWLA